MSKVPDSLRQFAEIVSADLRSLIVLHDRELAKELITALKESGFPDGMGLVLTSEKGEKARKLMEEGLASIPDQVTDEAIDALAADFADIYLTHGIQASPCESVWIDEEGLMMQEPMFQVRAWYEKYALAAEDWRQRSDDHLVYQIQFLSYLLSRENLLESLADGAIFLDEHLLRWIDEFATRVATRCATPFYAGLAVLTAAYMDELRDLIAEVLDLPRPTAEEVEERMKNATQKVTEEVAPYVPGVAPSW